MTWVSLVLTRFNRLGVYSGKFPRQALGGHGKAGGVLDALAAVYILPVQQRLHVGFRHPHHRIGIAVPCLLYTSNLHADKALCRERMRREGLHIRLQPTNKALVFFLSLIHI